MTAVAFESAEEFLAQYRSDQAGCVVTDLRLRGMSGLELLDRLAQDDRGIPVILVTGFAKTHLTVRAVKTGAVTVLEKPYDDEDLWSAIRNALLQDQERRDLQQRHHELVARFDKLTAQEREVLDLIVAGLTNRQMADRLSVSTRTIESRRHNVFQKTEAKSIAELVKMALAMRGAAGIPQGS
jgi:FixJ family two-component response regulator